MISHQNRQSKSYKNGISSRSATHPQGELSTEAEKTDSAVTKRKPKTDSDQSVNEKLLAGIHEIKTDLKSLEKSSS